MVDVWVAVVEKIVVDSLTSSRGEDGTYSFFSVSLMVGCLG